MLLMRQGHHVSWLLKALRLSSIGFSLLRSR